MHETCTMDWDHSKEAWSLRLREVWLLLGWSIVSRVSQQPVQSQFYFLDPIQLFLVLDHFS